MVTFTLATSCKTCAQETDAKKTKSFKHNATNATTVDLKMTDAG